MISINTKYEGNETKVEATVIINGKERNHKNISLTPKEYADLCDKNGWEIISLTLIKPEDSKIKVDAGLPNAWKR